MKKIYFRTAGLWLSVLLLLTLGLGHTARAQAGQFGPEWINPSQSYYKIKITKNGLYRLDHAYLTQAGISGVEPRRFQLWRRGQEVAIYVGGSSTQLDQNTFIEFYGQRNDGKLDRDMYKSPADQPHQYYSMFTDTAAYFLTWSATATGRRMAEPTATATAAHGNWVQQRLQLYIGDYNHGQTDQQQAYLPWGDTGEGFLSGRVGGGEVAPVVDSLHMRESGGQLPQLEVVLVGSSPHTHSAQIAVSPGTSAARRVLGTVSFGAYQVRRVRFTLQRSDIGADGRITIAFTNPNVATSPNDRYRIGYSLVKHAQRPHWVQGRRQLQVLSDSTLSGVATFDVDSIPATVFGYDVTDPYNTQRITSTSVGANRRRLVFPAAAGRTRVLHFADAAQPLLPLRAQRVRFRSISPTAYNYLIVSHQRLMKPAGAVANPVREYASYRASVAGGRYDTLVVTTDQVVDQFHYGERSALAVRRFASYMLTVPRAERYLLLLGKGTLISEEFFNSRGQRTWYRQGGPEAFAFMPDLVPASTRSGSDTFFSADWQNNSYIARIPTGRVAARTPADVMSYLNKLKEHEALGPEPWRKNILHLAGGKEPQEFAEFQSYLRSYRHIAEGPLLGAKVDSIYRSNVGPYPVTVNLAPKMNQGLSLITYFGHGSTTELDLTPADIDNPTNQYAHQGKYPVFFVSGGCAAGNNYTAYGSMGEQWTLSPNKGAVGFLGNSDFGLAYQMHQYSQRLYELMFRDPMWYGKPVAVAHDEAMRRTMLLPGYTANRYAMAMAMNTTWQGDPALRLFSPDKPDYAAGNVSLTPVGPGPLLATTPGFNLNIDVRNLGKVITDSVRVTVTRQVGSQPAVVYAKKYGYFRTEQTIVFPMSNVGLNVAGVNTFTVKLDDPNVIPELNENNNTANVTFTFLTGGVTTLNPPEFAIVDKASVRLVGQSNLPQTQTRIYEFELDTIPTFNSPFVRRTVKTALDVADWRPSLPAPAAGRDSVVYYWRFRLQSGQAGQDDTWANSSFRFIPNHPGGWSQSHYGQFARNDNQRVSQAVPSGRWEFDERTRLVQLITNGGGSGGITFQPSHGVLADNVSTQTDNCGNGTRLPNIMAAIFEPRNLRQVAPLGAGYAMCGQAGAPLYDFGTAAGGDINTPAQQARLLQFLRAVPSGHYVALVTMNRVNFSTMDPALKAELTAMGSRLIGQAQDGDPLVMMLRKGFPAQIQERTFDPANATPRQNQTVSLATTIRTREGSATITSTRIGPAQQWVSLYHQVRTPEPSDSYTLRLIGYDRTSNNPTVLQQNVTSRTLSLSGISAQQYPYLQLQLELRDTTNRTAPQLEQWLVNYRGVPEGVVRRDLAAPTAYQAATLSTQAASTGILQVPVHFENVSAIDFPPQLQAVATFREDRPNGQSSTVTLTAPRILKSDSVVVYDFRLNVATFKGAGTVRVEVNPRLLPELHYFNNELNLTFVAPSIMVPPVLDVAFDGVHILNGDIVSPTPEILVDIKYEDRRRPLDDPSKVSVFLTRPGGTPQQISMQSNAIRFVPDVAAGRTRVYYTPGVDGALPDGVYKLEVQAKDMNDNQAGAERYAVTFEVINTSSITNIYPYPNPVTSKAKFVFTLTGAEVPRNMKIQIMTLTGKVVREIMQSELGALRIGSNITEYAWDGTDEFGDKLANGTYLYRVSLDDAQNPFEHRRTAGDQAFKKGWGKIVLLR